MLAVAGGPTASLAVLLPSRAAEAICVAANANGQLAIKRIGEMGGAGWVGVLPGHDDGECGGWCVAAVEGRGPSVAATNGRAVALVDLEGPSLIWEAPWEAQRPPWHGHHIDAAAAAAGVAMHALHLDPGAEDAISRPRSLDGGEDAITAAPPARRTVSYSPGWRVLAAVDPFGRCALWDPRCDPLRGPVARVALPPSERAAACQIDAGGECWAGGLFVAAAGSGAVHLFDIRRAHAAASSAAVEGVGPPFAPRGRAPMACFSAARDVLVGGGGARGQAAFQWQLPTAGMDPGSQADADADAVADAAERAARLRKPSKMRVVRHHNRASRPQ